MKENNNRLPVTAMNRTLIWQCFGLLKSGLDVRSCGVWKTKFAYHLGTKSPPLSLKYVKQTCFSIKSLQLAQSHQTHSPLSPSISGYSSNCLSLVKPMHWAWLWMKQGHQSRTCEKSSMIPSPILCFSIQYKEYF